jgi:hypothetical protein
MKPPIIPKLATNLDLSNFPKFEDDDKNSDDEELDVTSLAADNPFKGFARIDRHELHEDEARSGTSSLKNSSTSISKPSTPITSPHASRKDSSVKLDKEKEKEKDKDHHKDSHAKEPRESHTTHHSRKDKEHHKDKGKEKEKEKDRKDSDSEEESPSKHKHRSKVCIRTNLP